MTDATATGALLTATTSIGFEGPAYSTTLLLMEGWAGYSTTTDIAAEYAATGSYQMNTSGGRWGGNCIIMANGGGAVRKQLGVGFTQAWTGFAHHRDRVGGGDDRIAQWCSGNDGTIELTLTFNNSTGILKVWRGNLVTLLASSTAFIANPQSFWHFFDWGVTFDGSAGRVEVYCDGVRLINATGLNTKQTSATYLSAIQIGSPGVDAVWLYYSDWYATLGPRIGDMRVAARMPTSDASPNVGTPSTGTTHWSLVDENPINYTDYVTLTNVNGNAEMFGLASLTASAITVYGVRVSATGLKSNGVNAFNIAVVCKSGASSSVSDPLGLSSGTLWAGISKLFPSDPATGAAWTVSAAGAMTAGVQVVVV